MDIRLALTNAPVCASLLFASPSYSQTTESIPGDLTPTSQWGSGWLVLTSITDFKKGEVIKLKMGKTADKVVVEFDMHLNPRGHRTVAMALRPDVDALLRGK